MTKQSKPKTKAAKPSKANGVQLIAQIDPESRKGRLAKLFRMKGRAAAETYGKQLKLSDSTVRRWLARWSREGRKSKST